MRPDLRWCAFSVTFPVSIVLNYYKINDMHPKYLEMFNIRISYAHIKSNEYSSMVNKNKIWERMRTSWLNEILRSNSFENGKCQSHQVENSKIFHCQSGTYVYFEKFHISRNTVYYFTHFCA